VSPSLGPCPFMPLRGMSFSLALQHLHSRPWTLHPTPYTLDYILDPGPWTLILDPEPQTLHPNPPHIPFLAASCSCWPSRPRITGGYEKKTYSCTLGGE